MDLKGYLVHLIDVHLAEVKPSEMDEFVEFVLENYLKGIYKDAYCIDFQNAESVKNELKDEIIEITRIKTYGYYNLEDYRRHKLKLKNIG